MKNKKIALLIIVILITSLTLIACGDSSNLNGTWVSEREGVTIRFNGNTFETWYEDDGAEFGGWWDGWEEWDEEAGEWTWVEVWIEPEQIEREPEIERGTFSITGDQITMLFEDWTMQADFYRIENTIIIDGNRLTRQ